MVESVLGSVAPFFPVLQTNWLKPLLFLSISDKHKTFLTKSPKLIPLMLDTLDSDRSRAENMPEVTKVAIQQDLANCCKLLSWTGRTMLAEDPAAMDALHPALEIWPYPISHCCCKQRHSRYRRDSRITARGDNAAISTS